MNVATSQSPKAVIVLEMAVLGCIDRTPAERVDEFDEFCTGGATWISHGDGRVLAFGKN